MFVNWTRNGKNFFISCLFDCSSVRGARNTHVLYARWNERIFHTVRYLCFSLHFLNRTLVLKKSVPPLQVARTACYLCTHWILAHSTSFEILNTAFCFTWKDVKRLSFIFLLIFFFHAIVVFEHGILVSQFKFAIGLRQIYEKDTWHLW